MSSDTRAPPLERATVDHHRSRVALVLAWVSLAPLALLALLAPWLPLPLLAALVLAYSCVVASVTIASHAAALAGLGANPLRATLAALVGLLLGALALASSRGVNPGAPRDVLAGLASTCAILLVATSVGASVGWRVPHRGHLLPVALVSTAVDLWSVFSPEGPTRALASAPDPAWLRALAASAPVPPSRAMEPMLGFADAIFAALYLAAAHRHRLSTRRATFAVALGLFAAGAVAVALRRPLPALPFVGAMVVALIPEGRRVPSEDRPALFVAAALVLLACARLAWIFVGR
jgi:hypothetical protein